MLLVVRNAAWLEKELFNGDSGGNPQVWLCTCGNPHRGCLHLGLIDMTADMLSLG